MEYIYLCSIWYTKSWKFPICWSSWLRRLFFFFGCMLDSWILEGFGQSSSQKVWLIPKWCMHLALPVILAVQMLLPVWFYYIAIFLDCAKRKKNSKSVLGASDLTNKRIVCTKWDTLLPSVKRACTCTVPFILLLLVARWFFSSALVFVYGRQVWGIFDGQELCEIF